MAKKPKEEEKIETGRLPIDNVELRALADFLRDNDPDAQNRTHALILAAKDRKHKIIGSKAAERAAKRLEELGKRTPKHPKSDEEVAKIQAELEKIWNEFQAESTQKEESDNVRS